MSWLRVLWCRLAHRRHWQSFYAHESLRIYDEGLKVGHCQRCGRRWLWHL